jgi:molybdopterin molybdotransferase
MRDMLGREELILVAEALRRLLNEAPFRMPLESCIMLDQSYDRILSREIAAPEDLPSFRRSTIDGFAVFSSDTFGATENLPVYISVKGEILMGAKAEIPLGKGECVKIATGGMLPAGADAAVMLEHTQYVDEGMIEVLKPVSPGENVIQPGEDVGKGKILFRRGHLLRPQDIGALAGLGMTDIWVYEKPRVSVISTGDEIVPVEQSIGPGQVRDINSYTLKGLIDASGGMGLRKGIFIDRYEIIKDIVASSLKDSEMVLISGGSSVGAKDLTAGIINDLGKPGVLFHGVAIKPGKPTIGGVVERTPVFGLPGHPAAVTVCFDVFIKPLLEIQSGLEKKRAVEPGIVSARIDRNISSGPGREERIAVKLVEREEELWAVPLLGKSGLITTLAMAEGMVTIPLTKTGLQKGESVEVNLF